MKFTYICGQCGEEIELDVTPPRPAPFCQNHDSPAFSDPGDPGEVDGPDECPECGHAVDREKVLEQFGEHEQDRKDDYRECEDEDEE